MGNRIQMFWKVQSAWDVCMGVVYDIGPLRDMVFWRQTRCPGVSEAPVSAAGAPLTFSVSTKIRE